MPTICSARQSLRGHAQKWCLLERQVEPCARLKSARAPKAPSSQFSRAPIVVGRSYPLPVCIWCKMHCSPSLPVGHLGCPSRNPPPVSLRRRSLKRACKSRKRSEEHTSELQSPDHLVCRLLLEKKKKKK